jgi:deoxycytidine triphosphate deaminase
MSVLARNVIEQFLRDGAIVDGTWKEENLRGAAYDLRIARDYLVLPEGRRYWQGGPDGYEQRQKPFWLMPGEVSFVSTVEELRMPANLVANVAVKFRNSLNGILVMGGFLVDPGYRGRLHFQLANIGRDPFLIVPEQTSVAALQFLRVEGDTDLDNHPPPDSERLLKAMFNASVKDEQLDPLAFFTLRKRVKKVERKLNKGVADIALTRRNMNALVVFGLIVIFAAILAGFVVNINFG